MISDIRFDRKNTSLWHSELRKCTNGVEPGLLMKTNMLGSDTEILGVQDSRGTLTGGAVEPWRGFKDKTPWRPMFFRLCHLFPLVEVDPLLTLPRHNNSASVECRVDLAENAQGQLELRIIDQWHLSTQLNDPQIGWKYYYRSLRNDWKATQKMNELGALLAQELQTIVPVIFDPQWWWSFKYSEEANRQEYWQEKIDKSKKSSDKFATELVRRQMMVPV